MFFSIDAMMKLPHHRCPQGVNLVRNYLEIDLDLCLCFTEAGCFNSKQREVDNRYAKCLTIVDRMAYLGIPSGRTLKKILIELK